MHRMTVTFRRNLLCLAMFIFASVAAFAATPTAGTLANLEAAYAAQTAAQAELTAFAAQADTEGYKSVSALFRAAARSKSIHLPSYEKAIKALGGVKPETAVMILKPVMTTRENLETALKSETDAAAKFAGYIKQADADKKAGILKEDAAKASIFFGGDTKSGAELSKLYKEASANLDAWKPAGKEFFVCTVCSHIMTDATLKQCPVCSAPREKFESFK
jgi:rubrerythrin